MPDVPDPVATEAVTSMDAGLGLASEVRSRRDVSAPALAADEALDQHLATLSRFCRSRTSSEADAQDAVQSTFVRYLQQRRPEEIRNLEAWLIRAASRTCLDINRQRMREGSTSARAELRGADVPDPEDVVAANAVVTTLFHSLSSQDALLLARLYLYDWTPSEVAAAMGLPANTVRAMAFRARHRAHSVMTWLTFPSVRQGPQEKDHPASASQQRAVVRLRPAPSRPALVSRYRLAV